MTCQECVSELATGSLRDLTPDSDVMRHCATCPDCGPLATLLREREYDGRDEVRERHVVVLHQLEQLSEVEAREHDRLRAWPPCRERGRSGRARRQPVDARLVK